MTTLQTFSEKKTEEKTLFGIKLNEFYLRYHYKGKEYEIKTSDLKEFFSIKILGINKKTKQ